VYGSLLIAASISLHDAFMATDVINKDREPAGRRGRRAAT
jgi:hypothetical protein